MRALAVTAVVVYHLDPDRLPGGFLGVDVFFVLSGFLITDLLLAEHRANGTVGLGAFWAGRARRLLPPLLVVLVASTAAAVLIRPTRATDARGFVLSALTFTNNWWQTLTDASYFASSGPPPLFMHLWTLSVEEQFYLVWPPLLLALLAGVRVPARRAHPAHAAHPARLTRLTRRTHRTRFLLLVPLGLAAVSAAAMWLLHVPDTDSSRLYFGTDTHAFPLLIGAALALAQPAAGLAAGFSRRVEYAAFAGIAVLGGCAWTADGTSDALYPCGFLLASAAAAAVVLGAVQTRGPFVGALSAAPLRWLGKRSYGIYLWHLPALSLAVPDDRTAADAPLNSLAAAAISVVLGALSYRWIEEPVRHQGLRVVSCRLRAALAGPAPVRSPARWGACGLALAAAVAVGLTAWGVAAPPPGDSAADRVEAGQRALDEAPSPSGASVRVGMSAIGDSVMVASAPALKARFPGMVIDAKTSRQLSAAAAEVRSLKAAGTLGDTVVIGLGTNGVGGRDDLESAVREAGPGERIVLVTAHVPKSWQIQVNRAIAAVAEAHPNVAVADWDKAITGREALLAGDHVHPGPRGGRVYADTVGAALASFAP
ncbi:acyltransferase family protein [Streptomyces sp. NPDC051546]|uniref:acyltransferase family protein n=1 Tax=Streptomyces sp. NPDC051546 TaxID=3365655 RepID=UPI003799E293